MKSRFRLLLCLLFLPFLFTGCFRSEAGLGDPEVAFDFYFFYRESTSQSTGEQKKITLDIPFVDGPVPEISLGIEETVECDGLYCSIIGQYNSLIIFFRSDEGEISRVLYQFPHPPENLEGGHGFTGLHYVKHPNGEGELQFWSVVRRSP